LGEQRYDLSELPLDELERDLAALEAEKEEALRHLGALEARYAAPDRRAALEAEIERLKRELDSLNLQELEDSRRKLKRQLDETQRELAAKQEEIGAAKAHLPLAPAGSGVIGTCPLLARQCPVAPADQERALRAATQARVQAEQALKRLAAEARALEFSVQTLEKRHEKVSAEIVAGVRLEEEIKLREDELGSCCEERPSEAELKSAREAIDELTGRILRGREIVARTREYRAAVARDEQTEARLCGLEKTIEQLDIVAPAFEAAALPAEFARRGLVALLEGAQHGVEAFGVAFTLDDDCLPLIQGKPYYLQSKSGQFRGALILADAIAQTTRVPWLLLDDCEKLDVENRANLLALVTGGRYAWVGIFAAQAMDEAPPASDHPEIEVWYLDGSGKCERRAA